MKKPRQRNWVVSPSSLHRKSWIWTQLYLMPEPEFLINILYSLFQNNAAAAAAAKLHQSCPTLCHSQEDTLKVLWAMTAFYVFHGHHLEKQSSIECINPIFGPVVLLQFWLNLITFQWHLVYVSDVAASSLDKGLPVYSPVSPGQCTGVTCTNIRLRTGSSVA